MSKARDLVNSERRDFDKGELLEGRFSENPFELFSLWMEEAISKEVLDPYAMCISTLSKENKPHSRILYLRDYNPEGFIFYTNYNSDKGINLLFNKNACLNFYWDKLERQIRIEGEVEKVSPEISDAYFNKRPKSSQIGAWASDQSGKLQNREELEQKVARLTEEYKDKDVPRPPHWGGYILKPTYLEFWQGRPSRLHDRIAFNLEEGKWDSSRLSP